jgi:hypothetical protein
MGTLEAVKVLQDTVGPAAANAVVELVRASGTEWKAEMLTQTDERMERRFAEMHRRVHSDFMEVGAGIRAEMQQEFAKVNQEFGKVNQEFGKVRAEISQVKVDMVKWMVGVTVIQAGLLVVVTWAGKHLM